jgi:hypothetical protein
MLARPKRLGNFAAIPQPLRTLTLEIVYRESGPGDGVPAVLFA